MWQDLSKLWQTALEEAWCAYLVGTIPIGAVITNEEGRLVAVGRNRIYEKDSPSPLAGTNLAHAEMDVLRQIKAEEHPQVRTYTLYSTMEPCPMCFGAAVMVNIRRISFGARDAFAGATQLADKMAYIKSKKISVEHVGGDLEAFHLVFHTAYELDRNPGRMAELLDAWRQDKKKAVDLGVALHGEGYFNMARQKGQNIAQIYNAVLLRYGAS